MIINGLFYVAVQHGFQCVHNLSNVQFNLYKIKYNLILDLKYSGFFYLVSKCLAYPCLQF